MLLHLLRFAMLVGCWYLAAPAHAHPEGYSGVRATVGDSHLRLTITLHTRDFGNWFPPLRFPNYVADVTREMEATIDEIVEVQLDGEALPFEHVRVIELEVGLIEIDVEYALPATDLPAELLYWSKHLIHLPRGHQQLLFVEDRRGLIDETAMGQVLAEDVLSIERDASAFQVPIHFENQPTVTDSGPNHSKREPATRISFFKLGAEHIITGYDHLLFLAALLLVCLNFKQAAVIITCFTLAHSITLALAALDLVRLSSSIVEPLIALSIVYVAIENLVTTPTLSHRAAITCGFGLVHGLGFASVLRDIGLGTFPGGMLMPLMKFNLGVEAGQLCIASFIFPILLWLRQQERRADILVKIGSTLISLVGGYWFVTRVASELGFLS